MRIRGKSLDDLLERRRRERLDDGERYVDLRLDILDEITGEIWLTVGGLWDRRLKAIVGFATRRIEIRAHAGQRAAVEWFREWLVVHRGRRDNPPPFDPDKIDEYMAEINAEPSEVYSALFAGGRRAGKTWIGVALAIAYGVAFPDAIIFLAAPDENDWPEMVRYVNAILPDEWVDVETQDGWTLTNGARVELRSAYDPESLKAGRVDLLLLNEGQRMKKRAYDVARGNINDRSGLVLVCANPPMKRGDQQWVSDFAAEAHRGERAALYVEFSSLKNPHIDRRALVAMARDLDPRSAEIEIFGRFLAPEDAVAYNWSRLENELPAPEVGDVTREFLARMGEGDNFTHVIGIDVQRVPYMAAAVYRFYGSTDPNKVVAWIVDEIVLPGGDELSLALAMEIKGYIPDETLLIVDASGRYQHSRRSRADSPPPEWKGRGSFHVFKGAGWIHVKPPDRKRKRNPEIVDRVRSFTSMICSSVAEENEETGEITLGPGVRRLFADPKKAKFTCKAIREWKHVNGTPSRTQDVAHQADGVSYPIVRLFPRRLRSEKPGGMDPVAAKVDLRHEDSMGRVSMRGRRSGSDRIRASSRDRRRGLT